MPKTRQKQWDEILERWEAANEQADDNVFKSAQHEAMMFIWNNKRFVRIDSGRKGDH